MSDAKSNANMFSIAVRSIVRHFVFLVVGLLVLGEMAMGQSAEKRRMNVGLVPGVGTNGPDPKNFVNAISLNLFSGYSAAILGFEFSGIASFHTHSSWGFQLAGVANVIGGNRKDRTKYTLGELNNLSADFEGVQVAGLTNIVSGDFYGFQVAGLFNKTTMGDLTGVQFAGVVNYSGGYASGWQLSGLANVTTKAYSGLQLSLLLNSSKGDLYGAQVGFWNFAANLYGPKSDGDVHYGAQTGIINISGGTMDGLQIGLVNFAKTARGLQIGLVNVNTRSNGYPIGLVNIGDGRTGLKVGFDNVSGALMQLITGSKNLVNSFVAGYDSFGKNGLSLGYGIGRAHFFNVRKFFYHPELMVRTTDVKFNKFEFHPVYTLHTAFGIHFNHGFYFYGNLGVNYVSAGDDRKTFSPAYSFGICGLY